MIRCLGYGQAQQDYVIAKLALEQLPGYDKYRIIKKANNSVIAGLLVALMKIIQQEIQLY